MASLSRKFSCLQEGATEFDYATERIPASEDVSIVTTTQNTLVGDDLQDALDKLNRPTVSQLPAYSGNDLSTLTFYKNSTQTTPNRIGVVTLTYSGGVPTSEVWQLYSDADGTTLLKTVTFTHTWVDYTLTNTTMSTT